MPTSFPGLAGIKNVTASLSQFNPFANAPTDGRQDQMATSQSTVVDSSTQLSSGHHEDSDTQLSRGSPDTGHDIEITPNGSSTSSEAGSNTEFDTRRLQSLSQAVDGQSVPFNPLHERHRSGKSRLDTYIIVRPPISSSKNPLNLQIQLVIRRDKGPRPTETSSGGVRPELGPSEPSSSMTSEALNELGPSVDNALQASQDPATEVTPELSDSLGDRAEGGLARTNSWKSTGSYSTYNSSLNGRRTRVEPMFNLAVHSVVHPTSVYDAATDFKVARFLKRSVEVTGIGHFEPSEIRLQPSPTPATPHFDGCEDALLSSKDSHPGSEASENLAPANLTTNSADPEQSSPRIEGTAVDPFPKSRKFRDETSQPSIRLALDRFFKRNKASSLGPMNDPARHPQKDDHGKGDHLISTSTEYTRDPGSSHRPLTVQAQPGMREPTTPNASAAVPTFGTSPTLVYGGHPFAGLQALDSIISARVVKDQARVVKDQRVVPGEVHHDSKEKLLTSRVDGHDNWQSSPSSRPIAYIWSLTQTMKPVSENRSKQPLSRATKRDVMFRWTKARHHSSLTSADQHGTLSAANEPNTGRTGAGTQPESVEHLSNSSRTSVNDIPSTAYPKNELPMSRTASSQSSLLIDESVRGSGDNRSTHTSPTDAEESDPEDSETPWICTISVGQSRHEQHLATLTPAPHHPKVVGILKIPVDLRSIALYEDPNEARGVSTLSNGPRRDVTFSEEQLKDVVCVTALWLVAREEFGGLGKKRRS